MNKTEIAVIANIVAKLKEANLGCSHAGYVEARVAELNTRSDGKPREDGMRLEVASRLYLDTWIVPALEMLLPGEGRDLDLAKRLSR